MYDRVMMHDGDLPPDLAWHHVTFVAPSTTRHAQLLYIEATAFYRHGGELLGVGLVNRPSIDLYVQP